MADDPLANDALNAALWARDFLADGRQSAAAADIQRGVWRHLRALDFACLTELPLASGRRADVAGLGPRGEVWIVEIKSSLADFQADLKWPFYRDYCDRLFFAVGHGFPLEVLPEDAGLIIADRFGGEIVRGAPEHKLAGARRKAVSLRFARQAAGRLTGLMDPGIVRDREAGEGGRADASPEPDR